MFRLDKIVLHDWPSDPDPVMAAWDILDDHMYFIGEVTGDRSIAYKELPPASWECELMRAYGAYSGNGNVREFVESCDWTQESYDICDAALGKIGASKNQALLREIRKQHRACLQPPRDMHVLQRWKNGALDARLGPLDKTFRDIQKTENVIVLAAKYLRAQPHLQFIKKDRWQAAIDKLRASSPNAERRRQEALELNKQHASVGRELQHYLEVMSSRVGIELREPYIGLDHRVFVKGEVLRFFGRRSTEGEIGVVRLGETIGLYRNTKPIKLIAQSRISELPEPSA